MFAYPLFRFWVGTLIAFLLELIALILGYHLVDGNKFPFVAVAVVACISGLIPFGFVLGERFGNACTWSVILALAAVSYWVATDPLDVHNFWQTFRTTILALVVLSWVAPALWLWEVETGDVALPEALIIAFPFLGAVVGAAAVVLWHLLFRPWPRWTLGRRVAR